MPLSFIGDNAIYLLIAGLPRSYTVTINWDQAAILYCLDTKSQNLLDGIEVRLKTFSAIDILLSHAVGVLNAYAPTRETKAGFIEQRCQN